MLTKVDPEYGRFSSEMYCSDMGYSETNIANCIMIAD